MENMLYCLLVPFLGSVIKYLSKSRVKKEGSFGSQFGGIQSMMVGKASWRSTSWSNCTCCQQAK